MAAKVKLQEVIDALEFSGEENALYLDLDTGEVELVDRSLIREVESGEEEMPDLPEWQQPQWEIARKVVETDRMIPLPDQHDFHEWQVMRDFADSIEAPRKREEVLEALHGSGAFRMFRSTIRRLKLDDAWDRHRDRVMRDIAIEWCEENDVEWE
jgi:hypothetical protein